MRVTVRRCSHTYPAQPHVHTTPHDRWLLLDGVATSNAFREGRIQPGVFGSRVGTEVEIPDCLIPINAPTTTVVQECDAEKARLHPAVHHVHTTPANRYLMLDYVTSSASLREGRIKPGVYGKGGYVGQTVDLPTEIREINASQTVKPHQRESSMTITEGTDLTGMTIDQIRQLPEVTVLTLTSKPVTVQADGTVRFGCQTFNLARLIQEGFSVQHLGDSTGRVVLTGPATIRLIAPDTRRFRIGGRDLHRNDVNQYVERIVVASVPDKDGDLVRHIRQDIAYVAEPQLRQVIDAVREWDRTH